MMPSEILFDAVCVCCVHLCMSFLYTRQFFKNIEGSKIKIVKNLEKPKIKFKNIELHHLFSTFIKNKFMEKSVKD